MAERERERKIDGNGEEEEEKKKKIREVYMTIKRLLIPFLPSFVIILLP